MKVSLNWIKQYLDLELPAIDELVEKIGAQLGAVEAVENLGEKYHGIIIAKVVTCVDHPNADKLHVCTIDDGGKAEGVERNKDGFVQVVCGAPNVRTGMMVAWLPPGSTVPESIGKDPFVLEARQLRGVVSNGMLASPKELALGDSHEGLLELDSDAMPGDDFAEAYELNDYIIDIENKMFTHRPDLFGQLGVAREIAGITNNQFKSPDWYKTSLGGQTSQNELTLEVRNEIPNLVPRFMMVALSNVDVKPSPSWLLSYLQRVGVRPISNVVDITNYMMLLTGQPMHAYDYDKVKALDGGDKATVVVRLPHDKERIKLLNGKELDPRQEAIMIATNKALIGVGGVMGGADTEVDERTKNIILEVGTFDMYSVRRTSMVHGLFTDAVTRFTKGQSPLQNDKLLAKAVQELQELAGAQVASEVFDLNEVKNREWVHPPVPVTLEFINSRLGLQLDAPYVRSLLEHVEFTVEQNSDSITVTAPFWRTDVETREDVVEEIGRLHGFDKLPLALPEKAIIPPHKDAALVAKQEIREQLAKAGANEVLTYSFVHGDLLDKVNQDKQQAFQLSNALSPNLQYYRLSQTPSLLEKVHANIKAGYNEFALFEIGTVHGKSEVDEDGLPKEMGRVALVVASDSKTVAQKYSGAPYYQARTFAANVLSHAINMRELQFVPLSEAGFADHQLFQQMLAPFEPNRAAVIMNGKAPLGVVGEYKRSVARALKLPTFCAGFELFISAFTQAKTSSYVPLPHFPNVTQDITLKVPLKVSYQELFDFVQNELGKVQPPQTFPTLGPIDIYQREDDPGHKQITLRLTIANYDRTMTDAEVNAMLDAVAVVAKDKLGAERI